MAAKQHERVAAGFAVIWVAKHLMHGEPVADADACLPGGRVLFLFEGTDDVVDQAVIVGIEAK